MPPDLKAFKSTAAYYSVLFNESERLQRESPLLRQCLAQAPGNRVADLACGTGAHAWFFAEVGAHVSAFDLSPEMIAHAQTHRSHQNITYAQGDMRHPQGGPWDLAVCLGNSLSLLPTLADIERTLSNTHAALAPGGLFLLQVLNYARLEAQQPDHRVVRKQLGETQVTAIKNLVPQGNHTLLTLSFYAENNGQYSTVSETAVLLHPTLETLQDVAAQTGFTLTTPQGGFDGAPFNPETSPDLICTLQKPKV